MRKDREDDVDEPVQDETFRGEYSSGQPYLRSDPTPEQIVARAAAIREGWNTREELARRAVGPSLPWVPPHSSVTSDNMDNKGD